MLLALGTGLMWRLHGLGAELEQAREQRAQAQAALDITAATLAVQVERNQRLVDAMEEREQQLNHGAQRIDRLRAQARALGADDADSKEWANQPVPVSVTNWVRRLTAPAATGADESGAAVVSD